jgi:hypothetical protein
VLGAFNHLQWALSCAPGCGRAAAWDAANRLAAESTQVDFVKL